ncbi:MAG: hypothetical protein JXB32_16260, partial [Deltaproteobacteria bacterium]|nr:hypothetical protein [Deltaproteobacteria bacterium]
MDASWRTCRLRPAVWWPLPLLLLVAVAFPRAAAAQPDLRPYTWFPPPSATGYGSYVTMTFRVQNAGLMASGPFRVAFSYRRYTSSPWTIMGTYLLVSGVAAGTTTSTLTYNCPLPNDVVPGGGQIQFYVDSDDNVAESDELNNEMIRTIDITGRPDLDFVVFSTSPTVAYPGDAVTVTYRVRNSGVTALPTSVFLRFYYSTDSVITTADTPLTTIGISNVLASGYYPTSSSGTVSVTLPTSATPGTRYVGAFVDYDDRVAESDEADNTVGDSISVLAREPDLLMDTWSLTPTVVGGSGASVHASFAVRNAGTGAASSAYRVTFFYGDSTSTTGLTELGGVDLPAGLAAGATTPMQGVTLTLPDNVLGGTRYIHYFIDSTAQVAESNETNNRDNRSIDVRGRPDLQVSVLSVAPSSQVAGGSLAVAYRVLNDGRARTEAASTLRFYDSLDSAITTADDYLSVEVTVPAGLAAGASYPGSGDGTATVLVPAAVPLGTRHVGAIADYDDAVLETDELDNSRAAAYIVVASAGTPCTVDFECVTGHCVDGMCCGSVCGLGILTDCLACSVAAGAAVDGVCGPRTAGLSCGSPAGDDCDDPDTCDGAGNCLPNHQPTTTVCRPADGDCDMDERCDGAGDCPADALAPAGAACGDPTDTLCDLPDTCDGAGTCLPNRAGTDVECRGSMDSSCDPPERCDGAGACPLDVLATDGTDCEDGEICTTSTCQAGVCTPETTIPDCCHIDEDCEQPMELCADNACVGVSCRVCASDDECGAEGNRCAALASGSYCAASCDSAATDACPADYACGEYGGSSICLPAAGDCVCTPDAYEACHEGDVAWFDSCGTWGRLSRDCEGRGCAAGACCPMGTHEAGGGCVSDGPNADADADAEADADAGADAEAGADADGEAGTDVTDDTGDEAGTDGGRNAGDG